MNKQEQQKIEQVIQHYFLGTYHSDESQLRQAFHPNAHITGVINDTYHDWSLNQFIARVCVKPSAADKQELYQKKIISMEIKNNLAMVIAQVKVAELIFTDYITLLQIEGIWMITHKSFTA